MGRIRRDTGPVRVEIETPDGNLEPSELIGPLRLGGRRPGALRPPGSRDTDGEDLGREAPAIDVGRPDVAPRSVTPDGARESIT